MLFLRQSENRESFDISELSNKFIEVSDVGAVRHEREYPCCPGQIYPSVTFWVSFKMKAGKKPSGANGNHMGMMMGMMKNDE